MAIDLSPFLRRTVMLFACLKYTIIHTMSIELRPYLLTADAVGSITGFRQMSIQRELEVLAGIEDTAAVRC